VNKRTFYYFISALLIIGLGGIVAQTILLREMLILFSGNEFSIGVIIGSWVVWEAIGAFIGGKWNRKTKEDTGMFLSLIILFSISFPLSIYLTRIFKILTGIPPEMGVGIIPILYSSFFILLPTGFLHGFLFTFSCSLHNQITGEGSSSIGKVYFYEMLGTIIGGVLVNFLFIPYFNSFQIAIGVALLSSISCLFLIPSFRTTKGRFVFISIFIILVSSFTLLAGKGTERIHNISIKEQWQGKNVISYENSFYQNIVVVQNENQYTFFSDGIPVITTPVPNITFVEEFAHFPLLSHQSPETVLVLSGGAGGLINEILKYPTVKRIDYVEIDALLLKTIKKFTPITQKELVDPRVNLHYLDGRIFIKETPVKYDVVLLGLPSPHTLQTNRFFTQEFFNSVKNILRDKGILAVTSTGSLAYYSEELKNLNACIIHTLGKVFPYKFVIPGDLNLFMVSDSEEISHISPTLLYNRLNTRKIRTNLITLPHLKYRLDEKRLAWFFTSLKDTEPSFNKDFSPKGLFYNIAYHNLLFSPSLKTVFDHAKSINLSSIILFIVIIFVSFLLLQRKYKKISIPFAIATTGFSAMIFELILLLSFQIFYGYVFYEIGLLITAFMGGMAAGSLIITSCFRHIRRELTLFKGIEIAITVFSFSLFLLFYCLDVISSSKTISIHILFLFLLFISGLLTGIEFPIANRIYLRQSGVLNPNNGDSIGKTVGLLYSVDLFGGWIGGVIGGLILLPILGILAGCIMLAILKISSLLLLLTFPKK
jgi:spermidine synthase